MSAGGKGEKWWTDSGLLILAIVMLTMNGGATGAPLFSPPAFGFTNERHELRGEKFFCVISESLSDFFFFCRVNPNLKDLKPTFAFKTESLFVFFG